MTNQWQFSSESCSVVHQMHGREVVMLLLTEIFSQVSFVKFVWRFPVQTSSLVFQVLESVVLVSVLLE